MALKVDIHNHILPANWPDLKEVRPHILMLEMDLSSHFSRTLFPTFLEVCESTGCSISHQISIPTLSM